MVPTLFYELDEWQLPKSEKIKNALIFKIVKYRNAKIVLHIIVQTNPINKTMAVTADIFQFVQAFLRASETNRHSATEKK